MLYCQSVITITPFIALFPWHKKMPQESSCDAEYICYKLYKKKSKLFADYAYISKSMDKNQK